MLAGNHKSIKSEIEIQNFGYVTLLGVFQGFHNCFCFFPSNNSNWLLFFYYKWKVSDEKKFEFQNFSKK